jgi:hypothetical protein
MTARTLAALLLLAAATGCVDNNASLRISAACFPPAPNDDGSCSYPSTCDSTMLDNLWVDTTYTPTLGTLFWPFQVDNLRPDNSGRDGGTNTAVAFITGYKISYSSSTVSIPDVTLDYTTQTVNANSSAVIAIPVIPPSVSTPLAVNPVLLADVRAEIRATGHYADGQTFETGPFSVVVVVVNGRGAGAGCTDVTQSVVAACPQLGQSAIPLCK